MPSPACLGALLLFLGLLATQSLRVVGLGLVLNHGLLEHLQAVQELSLLPALAELLHLCAQSYDGLTEVELARRRLNAAVAEFEGDRLKLRESISKVEAEQDAKFRAFSADKLAFESMVKKVRGAMKRRGS